MKALRRSNTSSSASSPSSSPTSSWIHLRSFIIIASCPVPDRITPLIRRGTLKSPWSRRKRKRALSLQQWNSFFTPDGKLRDKGAKLLKIVRSGGVHPSIRSEVWPFLLGVYDLNSSEVERNVIKAQKRKEYKKLRRHCRQLIERVDHTYSPRFDESPRSGGDPESPGFEDLFSAESPDDDKAPASELCIVGEDESGITHVGEEMESSDSESSIEDESESMHMSTITVEGTMEADFTTPNPKTEDFATWQRIIRLDAVRANEEWITESSTQASVSEEKAHNSALAVGLKDYGHLEPYRLYHAARLIAVLEAYALYDPEIGYCQGMSDLLSPILAVMEDDDAAFWCFVGFMRKARHNFRLDEVGIRRQLSIVSRIIKSKDIHLYRHLEKLEAEDCFFVYRMVVVLFRRELTFEQTACLWEVMWADQAAIRAGIGKEAWGRIRLRAPPTDDLLLFAIAACVLQRRKLIIERYSSMDEIMRECNSMAGQLDVWKLLDDAHVLVVNLHDRI